MYGVLVLPREDSGKPEAIDAIGFTDVIRASILYVELSRYAANEVWPIFSGGWLFLCPGVESAVAPADDCSCRLSPSLLERSYRMKSLRYQMIHELELRRGARRCAAGGAPRESR